jgi:hypothetical protein
LFGARGFGGESTWHQRGRSGRIAHLPGKFAGRFARRVGRPDIFAAVARSFTIAHLSAVTAGLRPDDPRLPSNQKADRAIRQPQYVKVGYSASLQFVTVFRVISK